jgi:hypothetical protein
MSGRLRDMRCSSGSSLGEALLRVRPPAKAHTTPSGVSAGERLRRLAGKPLAREPSAGVGRKPSFGSRDSGDGGSAGAARSSGELSGAPESTDDEAVGAPTPPGGLLPVQRELDARRRRSRSGLGWSVVVLVGCSDCRGRREASCSLAAFGGRRASSVHQSGLVLERPTE